MALFAVPSCQINNAYDHKTEGKSMSISTLRQEIYTPSLSSLQSLMAGDMEAVNACILTEMQNEVALIPEITSHLIASGGKRLRPLLCVASARLCGYEGDDHILPSAAIEFIHTATLLHDDVVDESTLRRGIETANQIWSDKASILVGDFLFSHAFRLLVRQGSFKVLEVMSEASTQLAQGEVNQLTSSYKISLTRENYFNIIGAKTACLFGAATQVGAIVADAPLDQEKALNQFGYHLGIAFQLVDDMLDYGAAHPDLGKKVGDDFSEGKMTLPVILALSQAGEEERAFWMRVMGRREQKEGDFESALELLKSSGALTAVYREAELHIQKAKECLNLFPSSSLKETLLETCDFCLARWY